LKGINITGACSSPTHAQLPTTRTAAAASARYQLLSPTVAAAAAATTACIDPWLPAAAVRRQLFGNPLALLQKPGRVRGAR